MASYALIDGKGNTLNVIEWDGKAELVLPKGVTAKLFVPIDEPGPPPPPAPQPLPGTVDVKAMKADIAAIKTKLGM